MSTHLKLCLASATHDKCPKITHMCLFGINKICNADV